MKTNYNSLQLLQSYADFLIFIGVSPKLNMLNGWQPVDWQQREKVWQM